MPSITLEWPDEIQLDNTLSVSISSLIALNKARNGLILERDTARGDLQLERDKVTDLNNQIKTLDGQLETANKEKLSLTNQVQELRRQLLDAQKPPTVPPPPLPPVPPTKPEPRVNVWREEPPFSLNGLIMATIENSMTEPSPTQYTVVKRSADAVVGFDVDAIRMYLGPLEVLGHLDPKAKPFGYLGNLVDFVRGKKKHFVADGIDRVLEQVTDAQLAIHVQGLNDLCVAAVCWNDADKQSELRLRADVERIRKAGWTGPIIFSLRGSAKIETYAAIPNIIFEFQTFAEGESDDVFEGYVASDADILCLDLRTQRTKEDLQRIFSVALAGDVKRKKPRGYTLYTSKTRDWPATPDEEVSEIRKFTLQVKIRSGRVRLS
jgi:hypothetical protein